MKANNVSFGRVVAVSGKPKQIKRLNGRLAADAARGRVLMKDVTKNYINASSSGLMARAAQKGDTIEIYITGEDISKVKNREKNWTTIDGILANLEAYYRIGKMSISEIVENIL